MSVSLILDCREGKLIKLLQDLNINLDVKQLDIADIHVLDNSNQIRYIIERKSIPDLISSLKDGRYREQKMRVISSLKNNPEFSRAQFLYLIEGSLINENY